MTPIKTLIAALICLSGCTPDGPAPEPFFKQGDFVTSVVSNQRGQIVAVRCFRSISSCLYDVRFVGLSMTTNTSIMGSDGPIITAPLSVVYYMQAYELRKSQ